MRLPSLSVTTTSTLTTLTSIVSTSFRWAKAVAAKSSAAAAMVVRMSEAFGHLLGQRAHLHHRHHRLARLRRALDGRHGRPLRDRAGGVVAVDLFLFRRDDGRAGDRTVFLDVDLRAHLAGDGDAGRLFVGRASRALGHPDHDAEGGWAGGAEVG